MHEESMPADPAPGANIARVLFSVSKGSEARREPHPESDTIQSLFTSLKSEPSSISNAFRVGGQELLFAQAPAEVGSSLRKRRAGNVPQSVDRPSKRLSVEDHFSRDEVLQALVERTDSLIAKNKNLKRNAAEGDAKSRENKRTLMKNASLEVELEKFKYRVMEKEGDVAGLQCAIRDLESHLQEQMDKKDDVELELEEESEKKEPRSRRSSRLQRS